MRQFARVLSMLAAAASLAVMLAPTWEIRFVTLDPNNIVASRVSWISPLTFGYGNIFSPLAVLLTVASLASALWGVILRTGLMAPVVLHSLSLVSMAAGRLVFPGGFTAVGLGAPVASLLALVLSALVTFVPAGERQGTARSDGRA